MSMKPGCDKSRHSRGYEVCLNCKGEDGVVTTELNRRWARNIANNNPHAAGGFIQRISEAYLHADGGNQAILDEALKALREKYPTWDIAERLD